MSAKLLGADERVLMHMRTHGKVLFWPAAGLVACGAILGAGAALIPYDFRPAGQFAVAVVAGVLATWWSIIPFLRWRTTTYTLTNYRLITRPGVGGGLHPQRPAADAGPVVLDDVPDVEDVHVTMTELIHGPVGS